MQFYVHLDRLLKSATDGHFLEVKSRTWSRCDAQDKVAIIIELLEPIPWEIETVRGVIRRIRNAGGRSAGTSKSQQRSMRGRWLPQARHDADMIRVVENHADRSPLHASCCGPHAAGVTQLEHELRR